MSDESKLTELADLEGYDDFMVMLQEYSIDSVVPGICCNPGCDFTAHYEPDSSTGWCEECQTNTVKSCLILAGVI